MFILFLLFVLPFNLIYSQIPAIKSLRAFPPGNQLALPIVFISSNKTSKILIDFDVQTNQYPQLAIVFRFCNEQWKPYANTFLQNFGRDVSYNLNFEKLPVTITGADYHFTGSFPNKEVNFPFSGKWKYFIVSEYDTSKVFAEGYFYVINSLLNIDSKIKKTTLEEVISNNNELDRAFEIRTHFKLPIKLDPRRIKSVEIVQNHKVFNPFIITMQNSKYKYYEWNGTDDFTFVIKNIRPGNEHRIIDFRNTKRFYGKNIYTFFNFPLVSRFYIFGKPDLNGGEILTSYKNQYSNYYDVPFLLRLPENFSKRVFIVGMFNNWRASAPFELKNNKGLFSIVLNLKRGKYDFQFVTSSDLSYFPANVNDIELEGNFWETTNDYYIFIFYESPERGGYDEIIGFTKIKSTGKWND